VANANGNLVRFAGLDAEVLGRFHSQVLRQLPGVMRSSAVPVWRTVKKATALAV